MGLHPSLKIDSASSQQRSVLTRLERIKDLMKKGLWTATSTVTALPKTKIVRLKTSKAAKAKTEEGAGEQAAGTESTAPAAPPKTKDTKK